MKMPLKLFACAILAFFALFGCSETTVTGDDSFSKRADDGGGVTLPAPAQEVGGGSDPGLKPEPVPPSPLPPPANNDPGIKLEPIPEPPPQFLFSHLWIHPNLYPSPLQPQNLC